MRSIHVILWIKMVVLCSSCQQQQTALYSSSAYSIFPDRVVQDTFEAKALSPVHMVTNYQSPANAYQSANISFKFSINGKDNEMPPSTDHHFTVKGNGETPVIRFGEQLNQPAEENAFLAPETKLTIRVDMGLVLEAFYTQGYFTNSKGEKIFKDDFKGLYIAGNTAPLSWDFDNLKNKPALQLHDEDGDGIYETTIILNSKSDIKSVDTAWHLQRDLSAFPQYQSPHVLADAIYNMSMEEMEKAVEKDSTLRTGKEWAGVWTRDVSYSIILSMAYLQPKVAMNSLLRKVNSRKRIIQDTGTGGAWPVSSDRMIWAMAAWQIYLATGDRNWLQTASEVIGNSLSDDYKTVYDSRTGLVKGESSFLDWREQTYPKWMQPADIFESECLGTNAVHYQANKVMASMSRLLGKDEEAREYERVANSIKSGINQYLWMEDKGYYGQFLYGRMYQHISPKSEALGEALCVLFDIAEGDRANEVISKTPVVNYGIPCIYPQITGIPPYHNNGVWPFVQAYWLWASAKVRNEASVMESIAAIYRPAALFLTNKENFVAANGDFSGTEINSSNMLWSLSGNISLVHHVLFGIGFTEEGLTCNPFVPKALGGSRTLKNFTYRNAILNITLEGYGDGVSSVTMNGKAISGNILAGPTLEGVQDVVIKLNNQFASAGAIQKLENQFAPATPLVVLKQSQLSWGSVENAVKYQVIRNGKEMAEVTGTTYKIADSTTAEWQVRSKASSGLLSFASEPVWNTGKNAVMHLDMTQFAKPAKYPYRGFTGKGFVEISNTANRTIPIRVEVPESGWYHIDFRYSNGNGPINTENKCAIRSLYKEQQFIGSLIFPQRGTGEWSAWGYSNGLRVKLTQGVHNFWLQWEEWNENMNGAVNQAMLDELRITRMENG